MHSHLLWRQSIQSSCDRDDDDDEDGGFYIALFSAIHGHGNVLRNCITTAPIQCSATAGIEMFNSEPRAVKITSSTSSEASWLGTLHAYAGKQFQSQNLTRPLVNQHGCSLQQIPWGHSTAGHVAGNTTSLSRKTVSITKSHPAVGEPMRPRRRVEELTADSWLLTFFCSSKQCS